MNEILILHMIGSFPDIPGKKVFQKLSYFLQEAEGARLGVRFRMKRFGPYSVELESGLQELADRHLVHISGDSDEGFSISPSIDPPEELQQLKPDEEASLSRLMEKLGSVTSRGLTLELMASLHFLSRTHAYGGSQEDREVLVSQLRAWKGKKFDSQFIEDQIGRLEELAYLPTSAD